MEISLFNHAFLFVQFVEKCFFADRSTSVNLTHPLLCRSDQSVQSRAVTVECGRVDHVLSPSPSRPRPCPTNPQGPTPLIATAPKPKAGRRSGKEKENGRSGSKSEQVRGSAGLSPPIKCRPTPHLPSSCSPPRAAGTTKPIAGFVQSISGFTALDLTRDAASSLRLVAALLPVTI